MFNQLKEEVEKLIQDQINNILRNNETENYDKLPGLVEALKLIREKSFNN